MATYCGQSNAPAEYDRSFRLLPNCEHDNLKTNEQILMPTGTSPRGKDMKRSTLVSRGLGHTIKAENRFGGLAGASFSTPLGRVAFLICTNWQHEG